MHNRVHWAKLYLNKAELITSPKRGWFVATEAGVALLAKKPARIDLKTLLAVPAFLEFYRKSNQPNDSDSKPPETPVTAAAAKTTPEEQINAAQFAMQSTLRDDLLQRVLDNSPAFFERVIVDLLLAMGYGGSRVAAAKQLGGAGDGGVDGVINEDALGLDRVYFQAKRYAPGNAIGSPVVQGFVGSLVGLSASKGVFVTTSSFSQQAVDFVRHLTQRVILIDGALLTKLMIEHNVGVRVSRIVEFKRLDEDYFSEDE